MSLVKTARRLSQSLPGFTLAELLIALAILGVIAAFTIPKIIMAQQNQKYTAIAKESASMVSAAYQAYKSQNSATSATGMSDLTQFMNYVAVDTSTIIDDKNTGGSSTCSASAAADHCIRLHNGAIMRYGVASSYYFGGTSNMDATWFDIDPDGTYSGTTNGEGKAIEFWLYYNGRITSYGTLEPNTCTKGSCTKNPTPSYDPAWFNW